MGGNCKYSKPLPGIMATPLRGPRFGEFALTDEELSLFDQWAVEHTGIAGTPIDYFHYDRLATVRDPVYSEPIQRVFQGPFRLKAYFSYPDNFPEAREEGIRSSWNATIWIPRKAIELAHAPGPDEGDVFRVWDIPQWRNDGIQDDDVPNAGFYLEVTNASPDGSLFDNPAFVGFKLDVTRKTEYTPERFLRSQ